MKTHMCIHTHTYTHIHPYTHTYIHMHTYLHTHTHIYIQHTYTDTHTHSHKHILTWPHTVYKREWKDFKEKSSLWIRVLFIKKCHLKIALSYNATENLIRFRRYFVRMICKMVDKFMYVLLKDSVYENNIDDVDNNLMY